MRQGGGIYAGDANTSVECAGCARPSNILSAVTYVLVRPDHASTLVLPSSCPCDAVSGAFSPSGSTVRPAPPPMSDAPQHYSICRPRENALPNRRQQRMARR
ncbi:hypothetical protein BC834DRAFT_433218 [Gloeopeniophorella convolvens]|nr:hypothetical protein BC834DRAFT_433218 [Gloeopeniophorella convolvens]